MKGATRALASFLLAGAVLSSYAVKFDAMVYVTENGKKYHKKNCTLKHGSKGVKLSWAKSHGYTPCKVCKPPK